jgi:hypothetical protein
MRTLILAYIDPGSGALLLQAAIAGTVGALAMFRRTLASLAARLLGRSDPRGPERGSQPPSR